MRLKVAMVALVMCLAAPVSASAFESTTNNWFVASAVQRADEWWGAQGLVPCPATILISDKVSQDRAAETYVTDPTQGCPDNLDVWVDRGFYRRTLRTIERPTTRRPGCVESGNRWRCNGPDPSSRASKMRTAAYFCAVVTHERGHNLGYVHSDETGMHPTGTEAEGVMHPDPVIPHGCYRWARRVLELK